ncbi:MAG TPA: hypothetical protein VNL71_20150 [Chloroflexota bacterium]|nr:hypothetical protein [Chloroflexota bacterium]
MAIVLEGMAVAIYTHAGRRMPREGEAEEEVARLRRLLEERNIT